MIRCLSIMQRGITLRRQAPLKGIYIKVYGRRYWASTRAYMKGVSALVTYIFYFYLFIYLFSVFVRSCVCLSAVCSFQCVIGRGRISAARAGTRLQPLQLWMNFYEFNLKKLIRLRSQASAGAFLHCSSAAARFCFAFFLTRYLARGESAKSVTTIWDSPSPWRGISSRLRV